MSAALGRWVLVALGCVSASSGEPPSSPGEPLEGSIPDLSFDFGLRQPLVKGTPPFVRYQDPPPELRRRDCLANGTNYCFGDTANYCASCGTCCPSASSKWCCPSNGICCGSGCCASGQTCGPDGNCYLAPVTVTVQSTVVAATVTNHQTVTDTVARVVIESSTVNSVTEVTVTNTDATQTDYTYVTVTAIERRWLSPPTVTVVRLADCGSEDGESGQSSADEQPDAPQEALVRRQTQDPAASGKVLSPSGATSTITNIVSKTSFVTNVVHNTITTDSTSTVVTTTVLTNTKILNAKATVQATSTLTYTSRPPVTSTITHIADNPAAATSGSSPTSSPTLVPTPPNDSAPGLATPTIVGIAVGSTVFALAACVAAFALVACRRRRARRALEYENAAFGLGGHHAYSEPGRGYAHMRQPTFPRVAPAAGAVGPDARMSHARTASGFTGSTAVAAAADAAAAQAAQGGGYYKAQRASGVTSVASSYGAGDGYQHLPVEVPADEIHEVDGNSPSPGRFDGGGGWTPAPSPPLPQGPVVSGGQGFYRDF